MKLENIPQKEKFDQLVKGLAELEPIATELSRDAVHSQSPHIGPVRSRILAAIEGMDWHVKALAELPDPSPATVPADKTTNPKPSIAPDATAGAKAAR